jgi:hypothetical protein
MCRFLLAVLALVALALAAPLGAQAHPERDTQFPDGSVGSVPEVRTSGPAQVVCKPDSEERIRRTFGLSATTTQGSARSRGATRPPSARHIRIMHRRAHRSAKHRRSFSRRQHRKAAHRRAAHARFHRRPGKTQGTRQTSARVQGEGEELLKTLKACRHEHIQAAVNAAKSGERILIMPGVYREEPSRAVKYIGPEAGGADNAQGGGAGGGLDPAPSGLDAFLTALGLRTSSPPVARAAQSGGGTCDSMREFEEPSDGDAPVPNYRFQRECPNSRNLIAVIGDTNDDRKCDTRCNLQLEGMGRKPQDVLIVGDRIKRDIIRGDRADGLTIRNMTLEQGAFNNIDIVETNGFRIEDIETRFAQNYGALTFTSDHGLYQRIDAHGNGDSGVYPGSGPEGRCQRYGIEIRDVYSHDNILGYSGTAGNGVYTHDSRFEDNSAGIATDSFASGHPGMPQDCAKWENNTIKSNNQNFFVKERQEFCAKTPFDKRPREIVCPQFQVPVGTGIVMAGANDNVVAGNDIFDQWRDGILLLYVPASVRGENEPEKQMDTSNGNRYVNNRMGVRPDGTRDRNGVDFYWDEQGRGNCWSGNKGAGDAATTSDPASLPTCEDELNKTLQRPVNARKSAQEAPCATWNPRDNQFPPGCDWFTTPEEPK